MHLAIPTLQLILLEMHFQKLCMESILSLVEFNQIKVWTYHTYHWINFAIGFQPELSQTFLIKEDKRRVHLDSSCKILQESLYMLSETQSCEFISNKMNYNFGIAKCRILFDLNFEVSKST